MKKLFTLLLFVLVTGTIVRAQCSCGNAGPGNGNGNTSTSSSVQQTINITWNTVLRVITAATPDLHTQTGLNFSQLLTRYLQGNCTITLLTTIPSTSTTYLVRVLGGGDVIVVLDE